MKTKAKRATKAQRIAQAINTLLVWDCAHYNDVNKLGQTNIGDQQAFDAVMERIRIDRGAFNAGVAELATLGITIRPIS